MRRRPYLCLCLLLGLSGMVWAQQSSAPPSTPPSSPPEKPDASGLSRDLSFPEDTPAQPAPANDPPKKRAPSMEPPRSDRVQIDDLGQGVGDSSSKDTQVDLSPPADDAKAHPQSSTALADAEAASLGSGGIAEFHTWDPHKAAKSVEVGDFYFRRKNYRAAEDRYREALMYKEDDAIATFRLSVCLDKMDRPGEARQGYESYLKILPHGPEAEQARKALERLRERAADAKPAK